MQVFLIIHVPFAKQRDVKAQQMCSNIQYKAV